MLRGAAKAGYAQGRGPVEKKTSYRGAGAGRKEKVGEACSLLTTNADKKANTPAYQNYKKGMKKKDGTPKV